jgi:hypothetical protein
MSKTNYKIQIKKIDTVEEIPGYWTSENYIELLEKFAYPDAGSADKDSLEELLLMAITDYEEREAAVILMEYLLAEDLSDGQIQQLSNEMLSDKICEEYPVIELHSRMYAINQLLYKAYNGKFPNAKATLIACSFEAADQAEVPLKLTKEMALKLFSNGLSDRNIIKRLFDAPMNQNAAFPEAEGILWDFESADGIHYTISTSENWIKKDDFLNFEFEGALEEVKEEV